MLWKSPTRQISTASTEGRRAQLPTGMCLSRSTVNGRFSQFGDAHAARQREERVGTGEMRCFANRRGPQAESDGDRLRKGVPASLAAEQVRMQTDMLANGKYVKKLASDGSAPLNRMVVHVAL